MIWPIHPVLASKCHERVVCHSGRSQNLVGPGPTLDPGITMRRTLQREYYVYIMTNRTFASLYTGVTNDLERRVWQHKHEPTGYAKRHRTSLLVYVEHTNDVWEALAR